METMMSIFFGCAVIPENMKYILETVFKNPSIRNLLDANASLLILC